MALQSYACGLFALSLKVYRCCIEVVYSVLESIVHKSVSGLLIDHVVSVLILDHRPSHAAVTQDADLVAIAGIGSVGHLAVAIKTRCGVCLVVVAAACYDTEATCAQCSASGSLEKLSSVDIIFHSLRALYVFHDPLRELLQAVLPGRGSHMHHIRCIFLRLL